MHAQAQASGLPFPPLLRPELFDARGLPDWYCPVRRSRPLAPALLVGGGTLAMAALLFVAGNLTHSRRFVVPAQVTAQSARCEPTGRECTAVLQLQASLPSAARDKLQDQPVVVVSRAGAAPLTVRVVATSVDAAAGGPALRIAWPAGRVLPTGVLTVQIAETRPLIGWIAPRHLAGTSWGRQE